MAKIGRNHPCPCGSGRKYKHCCWRRDRAIEYFERTIAWMDAHPENFDPESREPFYEDIERLRGSLGGVG